MDGGILVFWVFAGAGGNGMGMAMGMGGLSQPAGRPWDSSLFSRGRSGGFFCLLGHTRYRSLEGGVWFLDLFGGAELGCGPTDWPPMLLRLAWQAWQAFGGWVVEWVFYITGTGIGIESGSGSESGSEGKGLVI